VNYLGQPDNGAILAGYMGSWLMSGAFLAIGCCMSALTKNQIIAFILTGITCLFLVLAGFPMVLNFFESWVPSLVLDLITGLSIISHFIAISKGVLALTDLVYFFAMMVLWLYLTHLALAAKAAD